MIFPLMNLGTSVIPHFHVFLPTRAIHFLYYLHDSQTQGHLQGKKVHFKAIGQKHLRIISQTFLYFNSSELLIMFVNFSHYGGDISPDSKNTSFSKFSLIHGRYRNIHQQIKGASQS